MWEGKGREKSLSLSREEKVPQVREGRSVQEPSNLGMGETVWPRVGAVEVLEGRLNRDLGKGLRREA